DFPLLRHIAADGAADADAAEQERSQADKIDELGETLGAAADRRCRVGPVANVEAALWEFGFEVRADQAERLLIVGGIAREFQTIGPAHDTTGLAQAGLLQRRKRHQNLRPIGEAICEPIRLLPEYTADDNICVPDLELAAHLEAETVEQGALDEKSALLLPQRAGARRRRHGDGAVERIGSIDGFHFDQHALASGVPRHSAKARGFADLPLRIERRALVGFGASMHALECDVAADQEPALARQSLLEGCRQRTDRGRGGDAERNAEDKDEKPARAGTEFAGGNRQRERQA